MRVDGHKMERRGTKRMREGETRHRMTGKERERDMNHCSSREECERKRDEATHRLCLRVCVWGKRGERDRESEEGGGCCAAAAATAAAVEAGKSRRRSDGRRGNESAKRGSFNEAEGETGREGERENRVVKALPPSSGEGASWCEWDCVCASDAASECGFR